MSAKKKSLSWLYSVYEIHDYNEIDLKKTDEVSKGGYEQSVSSDIEGGARTLSGQNGDLTSPKLTSTVQIIHWVLSHSGTSNEDYNFSKTTGQNSI